MGVRWRYRNAAGAESGSSDVFGSRQEAEDWLGAEWRGLLDAGVWSVDLLDGDELVYAMGLTQG